MTYSGDPSASDLDEVRYLLQDTTPATELFTDTEIAYLNASQRSPAYAAAVGAETLAARFASTPGSRTLGDVTVSYADMATRYTALAATLRRAAQSSPASIPAPFAGGTDTDPVFSNSDSWGNTTGGMVSDPAPPWPSD
jgi:hypothetical protein